MKQFDLYIRAERIAELEKALISAESGNNEALRLAEVVGEVADEFHHNAKNFTKGSAAQLEHHKYRDDLNAAADMLKRIAELEAKNLKLIGALEMANNTNRRRQGYKKERDDARAERDALKARECIYGRECLDHEQ